MTADTRRAYVNAVVANYVRLPGTPCRASRRDRAVAGALHDRGVPLRIIWAAFVLATVRRTCRSPQQPKLDTVRTLHYFLPAVDEVLDQPLDPAYVAYLAAKIAPHVQEKARLLAEVTSAIAQRSEKRVS